MKHFEELWEATEECISRQNLSLPKEELHKEIDKLFTEHNKEKSFGKILSLLCYLSFKWNINTFEALLKEFQDIKSDLLDDES